MTDGKPERFQSTRPVRGGTGYKTLVDPETGISIHPPRAGRDGGNTCPSALAASISIHPPRAGRDPPTGGRVEISACDFNPPAPCGAGLLIGGDGQKRKNFNPPAPCGAGLLLSGLLTIWTRFQSTRPVRGGTGICYEYRSEQAISIHPPRAGRDLLRCPLQGFIVLISIHPPRAGRDDQTPEQKPKPKRFQSTRPVRGGTLRCPLQGFIVLISIHPPRAGRDDCSQDAVTKPCDFNPPAPCGAGLGGLKGVSFKDYISIHPPRAGRDSYRR